MLAIVGGVVGGVLAILFIAAILTRCYFERFAYYNNFHLKYGGIQCAKIIMRANRIAVLVALGCVAVYIILCYCNIF